MDKHPLLVADCINAFFVPVSRLLLNNESVNGSIKPVSCPVFYAVAHYGSSNRKFKFRFDKELPAHDLFGNFK